MKNISELLVKLFLSLDSENVKYDLLSDKITITRKIKGQKIKYSIRPKKE